MSKLNASVQQTEQAMVSKDIFPASKPAATSEAPMATPFEAALTPAVDDTSLKSAPSAVSSIQTTASKLAEDPTVASPKAIPTPAIDTTISRSTLAASSKTALMSPAAPDAGNVASSTQAAAISFQPTSSRGIPPLLPESARTWIEQLLSYYSERIKRLFWPQGLALRLLLVFVLLPTLVVFLYLAFFASDIYLAEAKFAIRSQNQQQSLDMLSTFFRTSSSTLSDSYIVQNYIQSMDMINKVDAKLHVREHYADRSHDIWYRLTRNATQDEMLRYWSWAVVASFDPDTSIMTVQVKAFSPQMAQTVCQAILDASEDLVNAMNDRARSDAISLAQAEVSRAETRIRKAHEAMRQYRERTVILDPQAVASGLYNLVNQLEGEITKTAAELAEASTYMQADSPRVIMLQNRLAVLQKQLQREKARLASQMQGDTPLSALVSEFQSLTLEEEFAQKQLTSAMASLETAQVQAESKSLYVESFQKPMVPDEALYPRPLVFSLVFMLAAAVLLGLVSLIVAAIREHAGF